MHRLGARLMATAVAAAFAVMLATWLPARAQEPVPSPSPEASPSGEPEPQPAPSTAPTTAPTVEPVPSPTPVPTPPRASRLPLREGATGWRVREAQQRLGWLGYDIYEGNIDNERMGASTVAAVESFQAKFGFRPTGVVGPGTWDLLREVSGKVGQLPDQCLGQLTLCIDQSQRLVRLVRKDKPVLTLDARFGFEGAETREGTFRVHFRSRDHYSRLYRTWMPFALFFSGGQAVHYSPYFARDGYNGASHGCVNLRDYGAARWLFDNVPLGTRVHVYRS